MTSAAASATLRGRFPGLDGVRATAVLIVFVGHAPMAQLMPGPAGVTLFFFLSGFLITTLLRLESERLGQVYVRAFYLRRSLRIIPPLLVAVALALTANAVGLVDDSWTPTGLASSLLFFNNYYLVFAADQTGTLNTLPLWSLAVEEHFYLLFPALYIALRRGLGTPRIIGWVLVGLCCLVAAWRAALAYWLTLPDLYLFLASDTRIDELLAGCALALIANPVLGEWPRRLRVDLLWPVALALFVLSARYGSGAVYGVGRGTFQAVVMSILFAAVLLHSRSGPLRLLNTGPIRYLGRISYSFYLVHDLVLRTLKQHSDNAPVIVAVGFAASLLLASLMHRLVERPGDLWRHRLDRSPQPESHSR